MSLPNNDLPADATLSELGETFETLVSRVRPAIEARLARRWEKRLDELKRHGPEVLNMASAARDLTLRGGKRYRAALLAATFGGIRPEAAIEPALQAGVALELLQTYLLIQDDWMDGDATRRGGPSVHAALAIDLGPHLGAASAILASDLSLGMAFQTLSSIDVAPTALLDTIQAFCRINDEVVIGQQIDMLGSAEDVDAMHDLKTGSYTVRGPLQLGATLAGAPAETLAMLHRFSVPLGVAFQLRDDLLGTFGSSAHTGKPVGNDLRGGKRTAILAESEGLLDVAGRGALAKVLGHADASEQDVEVATHALDMCGARTAVVDRLLRLCEEARALAQSLPLAPASRQMLAGFARALGPRLEDAWGTPRAARGA